MYKKASWLFFTRWCTLVFANDTHVLEIPFQMSHPYTVEPRYNEVNGTLKITLLYQVSHYIRVQKQRNIKSWDQQNYVVIRGFCSIRPLYNEVPLYWSYYASLILNCFQIHYSWNHNSETFFFEGGGGIVPPASYATR